MYPIPPHRITWRTRGAIVHAKKKGFPRFFYPAETGYGLSCTGVAAGMPGGKSSKGIVFVFAGRAGRDLSGIPVSGPVF
jgi:hypothetical protein